MRTRIVLATALLAVAGCKCKDEVVADASVAVDAVVVVKPPVPDAAVVALPSEAPDSKPDAEVVADDPDAGLAEHLVAPITAVGFASVAATDESVEPKAPATQGAPHDDPALKYFRQLFVNPKLAAVLERDGFAVDGNDAYPEFFGVYEVNRYRPLLIDSHETDDEKNGMVIHRHFLTSIPSVVTPDLVLENLHLFFDFSLARAEETRFAPVLKTLVTELLAESKRQGRLLAGTPWAGAAEDNQAYFAVALALLDAVGDDDSPEDDAAALKAAGLAAIGDEQTGMKLSAGAATKARADLGRVLEARAVEKPAVFAYPGDLKEDFSQYTVRGHYAKTPGLRAYFRAVMWLSRVMMPVQSPTAVRSIALVSLAIGHGDRLARWQQMFDAITFLVGKPDDLSFYEIYPLAKATFSAPGALGDEEALRKFTEQLMAMRPPEVQGVLTLNEVGPALNDTKGFHFHSQRTVIDAVIFQSLVDPQVPARNTIDALEAPEVLGSAVAAKILAPLKLGDNPAYAAAHAKLAQAMPARLAGSKDRELYAGWLNALGPLLEPVPDGYPAFMRSEPYSYLRLDEYMASYAQLKHDTLLYSKQSAAEMGGPGFEDTETAIDDRGYVVPEIKLYARVLTVMNRLRDGLQRRGLFPDEKKTTEAWARFETLLGRLVAISRSELTGKALDPQDYQLIKFIGGDLEHFWEATLIARQPNVDTDQLLEDNNNRLIADIFTGPKGVTHVATGYVHPLYLAFPRDGKLALGRGAVMPFYQLTFPTRLTDKEWRELLRDKPPPMPDWVRKVVSVDPATKRAVHYSPELE